MPSKENRPVLTTEDKMAMWELRANRWRGVAPLGTLLGGCPNCGNFWGFRNFECKKKMCGWSAYKEWERCNQK
jgi:hypothetical protein